MGKMAWMSQDGDSDAATDGRQKSIEWDANDPDSIKAAKKQFKKLQDSGYTAFRVVRETVKKQGEAIRHFDPNAEEILFTAPMAGG